MYRYIILILYFITLLDFSLFAEVSFTVEKTSGGPQIYVDGNPVRPRMFWGVDRGGKVLATDQWKELSFDVTPSFDANGTWHFRFGDEPGEIWLTDVKITNSETGRIVPSHF